MNERYALDPSRRQRHRGHLQPRDPGAQGRFAAGARGQIVALLGGNGAGKTTTLRAISNLLRGERGEVTKGSIALRGERIEKLSTVRHGRARRDPGDGGAALLRPPDDRGEPDDRRLHAPRRQGRGRRDAGEGLSLFPAPEGAAHCAGRLHLGRRAADVRDRPRADGQPEAWCCSTSRRWAWRRRSSRKSSRS